jgi:hypothetical protein
MTTPEEAAALARHDRGLVVISTLPSNGTIQASLDCPGSDGGSQSMKDESYGCTEEVQRRAA